MNHRIDGRNLRSPWRGGGDVARDRRRAGFPKFFRRSYRTRQAKNMMPAFDEFAHHGCADRAGSAQNKNAHVTPLGHIILPASSPLSFCQASPCGDAHCVAAQKVASQKSSRIKPD
jgi:hypothetical protein